LSEQVDTILNTGHYADVDDKHRLLYSMVCLCRAILLCMNDDLEVRKVCLDDTIFEV
jgi:hypothetical protein